MIFDQNLYFIGLIFLRNIGFVFSSAFWGTHLFTIQIKILLSVLLTGVVYTTVYSRASVENISVNLLLLYAIVQLLLGIFLGFVTRFVIFVVTTVGELVGISSGSSANQIFNPSFGDSVNVFDHFYFVIIGLVFFVINGHHFFINGLVNSFEYFPPYRVDFAFIDIGFLLSGLEYIISSGIRLALPVVVAVFVVNLVMGALARMLPQINIFVTSLQITFLTTILVLMMTVPFIIDGINDFLLFGLNSFLKLVRSI